MSKIKDIRTQLMKCYYGVTKTSDITDDMEMFLESLKKFDNLSLKEYVSLLSDIKPPVERQKQVQDSDAVPEGDDMVNILKKLGIDGLPVYENVTMEQLELLNNSKEITKTLATQLANHLGVTKKTFKTRKDIFEDMFRMVTNRDTMKATKNVITNESPVKVPISGNIDSHEPAN